MRSNHVFVVVIAVVGAAASVAAHACDITFDGTYDVGQVNTTVTFRITTSGNGASGSAHDKGGNGDANVSGTVNRQDGSAKLRVGPWKKASPGTTGEYLFFIDSKGHMTGSSVTHQLSYQPGGGNGPDVPLSSSHSFCR